MSKPASRLLLVPYLALLAAPAFSSTWSPGPYMTSSRRGHTATLLLNGKVLVAGGAAGGSMISDDNTPLATAELYDPQRQLWGPTASLAVARFRHTATLLPDGRVLVVGGTQDLNTPLASAEIYDPSTGSWSATGSLATARFSHTATLLPNGKVLVVGGSTGQYVNPTASAEIYNPAANGGRGSWTTTGSLNTAREQHSATLLLSGKVLVAGGGDANVTQIASCELFDPAANGGLGAWTPTGSLAVAREAHTATLLPSGKVLVAYGMGAVDYSAYELYDPAGNGGSGSWTAGSYGIEFSRFEHSAVLLPDGRALVIGGWQPPFVDSAEIFDPAGNRGTGTVTSGGTLSTARASFTATLLPNGKVLVAGGVTEFGGPLASCEEYSPAAAVSGSWTPTGAPVSPGAETATLLKTGKVLAVGGSVAQVYDPAANGGAGAWTLTSSPAVSRSGHTATLLPSGKVLVAGGTGSSSQGLTSAEIYDPAVGSWSATGALLTPRFQHTATLLSNGKVLVVGGDGPSYTGLTTCEIYDPAGNGGVGSWTATAPLPSARAGHTATLLQDGRVLVAGGGNPVFATDTQTFDPAGNGGLGSWTTGPPLLTARAGHVAVPLRTGKVLVVGGRNGAPTAVMQAELYDPAANRWLPTGNMGYGHSWNGVSLLPNGDVLVVGGPDWPGVAEVYDVDAGQWALTAPSPGGDRPLTLLPSGKVLNAAAGLLFDTGYLGNAGWAVRSTDVPKVIGDLATITSAITVVSTERVQDVDVTVDINHTADGDLRLVLIGPNNARVTLANRRGGTGDNFAATTFDDEATTAITGGTPPFTGSFRPESPLSAFDGLPANGTWGLEVADFASGNTGSVLNWSLRLTTDRRPVVTTVTNPIVYGQPVVVTGTGFRGDSEAASGTTASSPVNFPVVQIRSIENGWVSNLVPCPVPNFWNATTLTVNPPNMTCPGSSKPGSGLPPTLDPGLYLLSVVSAGVASVASPVNVTCNVVITQQPSGQTVPLGSQAVFQVAAQGARGYQWEIDATASGNWIPIGGATGPTYVTPPVFARDSGSRYRVVAQGACYDPASPGAPGGSATSNTATLTIPDAGPPTAGVVSPSGGEYWLVSPPAPDPPNTQLVTWWTDDDVRVCQVAVKLMYSTDGGANYLPLPAGGGLLFGQDLGRSCPYPGVTANNITYTVPTSPPGASGALYRIQVEATDGAGNLLPVDPQTGLHAVRSPNPFYIVQSNPDSVRTLIFSNVARMQSRMGVSANQAAALRLKLLDLANNPKVLGQIVDLDGVTDVKELYANWDSAPANKVNASANAVLFGCHGPSYPTGCPTDRDRNGIHDLVRTLTTIYTGTKYVVLVGDDRIIPLARIQDGTALLPENNYPAGGDLTTATTVGQALNDSKYLSDDPLVVLDPVRPDQLTIGNLYIPDLAVGRLVETPQEITKAIATFISQDGVLDLSLLDPVNGHKVLVTGYDFLQDSGNQVRQDWKNALKVQTPDSSLAPVDGSLVGGAWNDTVLRTHLAGAYALMDLNGHATHYAEGVPGSDFRFGLHTQDIYGPTACSPQSPAPLDLPGGVVYALGCHGGLPVPGSCATDLDHSLDLPQTLLSRGVVSYIANSGYGWGLKYGIAYGERMVKLFTSELTAGGTLVVGDAVRMTKQRYLLETPRYDPYDEKSLMQWTLFGLPMYAVKTGISTAAARPASFTGAASRVPSRPKFERFGGVTVASAPAVPAPLPPNLTTLTLHFDFTAAGVYSKRDSLGNPASSQPGCFDNNGCYYTLNGLSTGAGDLPIEPYFIYDSRLSGTSQHGVLWKGGTYDEEAGWKPVFGELISNGADGSNHGDAPKLIKIRPSSQRVVPGLDPVSCRPSDVELNSTLVIAGEALKVHDADPTYSIERHYRQVDLEAFYFNNQANSLDNCDRDGPSGLAPGAGPFGGNYHQASGNTINWAVPVTDTSGVWRVLVVMTDNSAPGGRGTWVPVELTDDGTGTWRGSRAVSTTKATYVIQAVDNRGNVAWLDFVSAQLPSSQVPLGIPLPMDVAITPSALALSIDDISVTEDPVAKEWAVFTVSLSAATTQTVTVDFATADGSAFAGQDYTATAGTLTFTPGTASQLVFVPVLPGAGLEGTETFFVDLGNPSGAPIAKARGEAWILDNAPGQRLAFSTSSYKATEGVPKAVIQVKRTGGATGTAGIDYATSDGTAVAGTNYLQTSGTLTFTPGAASRTFTVPILNNTWHDDGKVVLLSLRNPTGTAVLGEPSAAILTIGDNDIGGKLQFGLAKYSIKESGGSLLITVKRLGGAASGVTVDFAASGGTAVPGVDYTPTAGVLSFGAGVTGQTFSVPILDDGVLDGDKTLNLTLSNATGGAALGNPSTAVLTILCSVPTLQFSAPRYSVAEKGKKVTIIVKRGGPLTGTVGATYATSDGTAVGGVDYVPASGPLTFGPGVVTRTFVVQIIDDGIVAPDENLNLTLTNPTGGAALGVQATAVLSITTDDPKLQFSAPAYRVTEKAGKATIAVRRLPPLSSAVSVHYATSDGTATAGEDYSTTSGTLSFAQGVAMRTFTVPILPDVDHQTGETFNVTLSQPSANALLGDPSTAVVTIVDKDQAGSVQFSASDYAATEAGPVATITVVRSGGLADGATVDYATGDGTASAGTNYEATTGTLLFASGETKKTFTVRVLDDGAADGNRTIHLTLGNPGGGAVLGPQAAATLWIVETR